MRLRHIPEAQGIVDASRFVIHEPKEMRGCWKKDADRPLYLEIGMGKGRFIIEMASTHTEAEYLGIERYASVLFRACERMEGVPYRTPADKMERARIAAEERVKASEGGLQAAGDAACLNGQPEAIVQDEERDPNFAAPENLHFLSMDARELPEVFAEGEVDGIYLPPWVYREGEERVQAAGKEVYLSLPPVLRNAPEGLGSFLEKELSQAGQEIAVLQTIQMQTAIHRRKPLRLQPRVFVATRLPRLVPF